MNRITPAHAGKTCYSTSQTMAAKDHPRACGENGERLSGSGALEGSPPRMRGKLAQYRRLLIRQRITPAHAGKTRWQRLGQRATRDHPRACGENYTTDVILTSQEGSPPRMRGKLLWFEHIHDRGGITPAHAGKTLRKWRISVVDPSPQPRSSLTSRRADASIGSQRAPCAAPV